MTEPIPLGPRTRSPQLLLPARPLPLTIRYDQAEIDALWAMTRQERITAMWASQLTMSQLTEWTARRPREVPLLGNEWAWLEMHTPEWAEPSDQINNVIKLQKRGEHRAAA
jgi:hypothetical protein